MDGIEILKTIEITTIQDWVGYGFIISVITLLLFTIVAVILEHADSIFQTVPYVLATISGIGVLFFVIMMLASKKSTGEYKQIMRVPDNISLNEFYEKYEILSKEEYTNVYTVKERIIE